MSQIDVWRVELMTESHFDMKIHISFHLALTVFSNGVPENYLG